MIARLLKNTLKKLQHITFRSYADTISISTFTLKISTWTMRISVYIISISSGTISIFKGTLRMCIRVHIKLLHALLEFLSTPLELFHVLIEFPRVHEKCLH